MTTLDAVVARVRTELGDTAHSFVDTFVADGSKRYERPYAPLDGASIVVSAGGFSYTNAVTVEESNGILVFDTDPGAGVVVTVAGTHYRYFTTTEISTVVGESLLQHTANRADAFGRAITISNLAAVEEYPLTLLATINALWVLATDSAFDIDILAPDGVTIPRSQRYRQLLELINERRAQYQQLCAALNIGLDRIEVFTLRRISHRTNRYVPVYRPQEIDDSSMPERVFLPIPTYGSAPIPEAVGTYDITLYQGDKFNTLFDFSFDTTNYTASAQIRAVPNSQVALASFTVTVTNASLGQITLSLTPAQTALLPIKAFWDLQLVNKNDSTDVVTYVRGQVFTQRQITTDSGTVGSTYGSAYPPLLYGSVDTGFTTTPPPGTKGLL